MPVIEFIRPLLCLCTTELLVRNTTQHTHCRTYHGDCSIPSPFISHHSPPHAHSPPNPQAQVFPREEILSREHSLRSHCHIPPTQSPGRRYPASVSLCSYSASCPLPSWGLIPLSPCPISCPHFCLNPSSPNTDTLIACSQP